MVAINDKVSPQYPLSDRPLVTFALFAYNQENYIREAVEGAFAQTYEPLEIIISDDCSTDRTFEIIKKLAESYLGPHKVRINRNPKNVGVASHFSQIVLRSKGEFIVLAAGDDISFPFRSEASIMPMRCDPSISFTETNFVELLSNDKKYDSSNHELNEVKNKRDPLLVKFDLDDFLQKRTHGLVGATRTLRRDVFLSYPPITSSCPTEDTPSVLRLLMRGSGCFVSLKAVCRRIHESNLSSATSMLKMNLEEIKHQYCRDIKLAKKYGWISSEQSRALRNWAEIVTKKRKIQIQMRAGIRLPFQVVARALWTSSFSFQEKISIVRYYLRKQII